MNFVMRMLCAALLTLLDMAGLALFAWGFNMPMPSWGWMLAWFMCFNINWTDVKIAR